MPEYHVNEGTLNLSAEWQDQTVNILSNPAQGKSLVFTRDSITPGQGLEDVFATQHQKLKHELPSFSLLSKKTLELEWTTAMLLEFTWQSDDGRTHQHGAFLGQGDRLLCFTLTGSSELTREEKEEFEKTVLSFRPRHEAAKV